ncbi:hypothetical protein [Domibacillus robiginosus]|uniref:hypothetical protein n=1 Tax=Domibacillus robiginosus TaxID=1071054 RepID=UPI000AD41DBE|nr:hypothetical protein [Domibacillus robiginosus]
MQKTSHFILIQLTAMISQESYVLGQKRTGYLMKQTITKMDATVRAIADRSIYRNMG